MMKETPPTLTLEATTFNKPQLQEQLSVLEQRQDCLLYTTRCVYETAVVVARTAHHVGHEIEALKELRVHQPHPVCLLYTSQDERDADGTFLHPCFAGRDAEEHIVVP